jgi:hypothetical protein
VGPDAVPATDPVHHDGREREAGADEGGHARGLGRKCEEDHRDGHREETDRNRDRGRVAPAIEIARSRG